MGSAASYERRSLGQAGRTRWFAPNFEGNWRPGGVKKKANHRETAMNDRIPVTLELELKADKPNSRKCEVIPLLTDGSSQFGVITNRAAAMSEVAVGDTIKTGIPGHFRFNEVTGVKVLDRYE